MKEVTSDLEGYPGSFKLPDPFLDRHMRAWWEVAVKPLQGMSQAEYEFYDAEWMGAVALITQFGAWDVEGVPVGDLETDGVPMAVKSWVTKETSEYVYPFLPPAVLRRLLGIS